MELSEAVLLRRMTRNFTAEPIDPGVVDQLVAGALRAPSAGNTQGREFVVLEGSAETGVYWEATTDPEWRARSRRFAGLSRATVVVLSFVDPAAYAARYREPDKVRPDREPVEWVVPYWYGDAAFAVMTMLLGATESGLGVAFLGNFRGEDALRSALGVPDHVRWFGAVLLGEAATPDLPSSSATRRRRTVEESVHRGRW